MKQEACSQILYFLFRDLERAYESKTAGVLLTTSATRVGVEKGEKRRSMDIIGPT